uniref:Cytochrome P450 CYP94D109 n=1 Tax=Paris polyphylla TaxID=49666 RepID=94D19_PARPY|nr:RecName: Full=Cytochrome P450 CYP94D109; Short=PpCYP94D109 [Paris polyphylla]QDS03630.1 cytochrome P450 CYP94D109 [Paris polyphylla]
MESLSLIFISFITLIVFLVVSASKKRSHPSGYEPDIPKGGCPMLDSTAYLVLSSPTNTAVTSTGIITSNPENIEHVLKTNFANYPKGEHLTYGLYDLLGRGIFNSDGDHWKLQRKIASLEFNTRTIRHFVTHDVSREVLDRLLPSLSRAANSGEIIDLQEVLDRLAFDNVCKIAFDDDPARLADKKFNDGENDYYGKFAKAFGEAAEISTQRFEKSRWKIARALNLGTERKMKNALAIVNEFAMQVVREMKRKRAEEGKGRGSSADLLSLFISEGEFSDEFLRDVVISFVLAGRDTTSSTMAFFFWQVSTRPSICQKIKEEIVSVRKNHNNSQGGAFTLEELREMDYLHAVLSETLRLYPIVPLHARYTLADDVLPDGTMVKKGSTVMHSIYAMGRMESIWGADCLEFRPERWLENGVFRPKSPFLFPVFLAGPRMCLGKETAYMQMKAVAASVMEKFKIEVADGKHESEREYYLEIVLRLKGGLPVRVTEKEWSDNSAVNV